MCEYSSNQSATRGQGVKSDVGGTGMRAELLPGWTGCCLSRRPGSRDSSDGRDPSGWGLLRENSQEKGREGSGKGLSKEPGLGWLSRGALQYGLSHRVGPILRQGVGWSFVPLC